MTSTDILFFNQYDPIGGGVYRLRFQPADPQYGLLDIIYRVDYQLGTLDAPNNVFPTPQDAYEYHKAAKAALVVGDINSIMSLSLTVGDFIEMTGPVNEGLKAKQDKADSLEQVAAIEELSAAVMTMMAAEDEAAIKAALAHEMADIAGLEAELSGKAEAVHNHVVADVTDYAAATDSRADARIAAARGAANGIAGLDSGGKVPAAQLPSFVDDVLEYANFAALPGTGETGKIYILATPYTSAGVTSSQFRWSGSAYAPIIASPGSTDAVTEGSVNLYFTAARAIGALLTGLSVATATAVIGTDSVLVGIGKLQAQITALAAMVAALSKPRHYAGTTLRNNSISMSRGATVNASSEAVFYLTDDGTSTGNLIFANVDLDSLMLRAVEGSNPHSYGTPALSNGNKTLTVPVSKIAPILGILNVGQSAQGTVVKALIFGN
jgi:hypothetical protein